jgi:hypothetical protein
MLVVHLMNKLWFKYYTKTGAFHLRHVFRKNELEVLGQQIPIIQN